MNNKLATIGFNTYIDSIDIRHSHYDYHGLNGTCRDVYMARVVVYIDARKWNTMKKKGQLGQLYGVDISNEVHRLNKQIRAWNPAVNDRARASKGIKRIELQYEMVESFYKPKLKVIKGK